MPKYVYFFGGGKADGNESMKNLLGGKGANLAEMAGHPALKLPVPPGFTITTEVCTYYYENKRTYPKELKKQVEDAMIKVEKIMGKKFGNASDPLLISVRSAARPHRLSSHHRASYPSLYAGYDGHSFECRSE